MSSMKKNVLAVALVAGLGLAGGAAAYNYGTSGNNPANGPGATDSETALPDAENVAYQNLSSVNNYAYTMTEGLVWNVDSGDAYTNVTTGFTANRSIEAIKYYGGNIAGVASIYRAVDEVAGYPVRSIYSVEDIPDYESYDFQDCPYCKAGQKLDALVNSFGYSAL